MHRGHRWLWYKYRSAKPPENESVDFICRTANFIKCSKLGSGRCVLIGDSAHAHSANIGSGCTTALQDTTALAACVAQSLRPSSSFGAKSGVSVPADVADDWTRARLHDAHACVRISKCMEDMGRLKLHKSPLLFAQSLPVSMAAVISMMPLPGKGAWPLLYLKALLRCWVAAQGNCGPAM